MPVEAILRLGKVTGYPTGSTTRTQCRANVLFPENSPYSSPSLPAEDVFDFVDEAHFQIENTTQSSLDALISEPVKIILLAVSSDQRHQIPGFEFQIYLDSLLIKRHTSLEADLIGKHCENGEFNVSVTAPTLHISLELKEPLIPSDEADGSAIMRLKVEELKTLPKAIILSTLHQDDKVHPFEYNVGFRFPCGRIIQIGTGIYNFEDPIDNSLIKWDGTSRVFLNAASVQELLKDNAGVEIEIWRALSEDFASFPIQDTISNLVDGRAMLSAAEFTKPGQSHYTGEIPIRMTQPGEDPIRAPPPLSAVEEVDSRKTRGGKKPPSRSSATRRKPKRAITAKDKKQIKALQTGFTELTEADGFNSTSLLNVDLQFSHPLVNKPLVPHATLKPSQLAHHSVRISEKSSDKTASEKTTSGKTASGKTASGKISHGGIGPERYPEFAEIEEKQAHHLERATMEFKEAAQRLAYEVIAAQKMRQECQLAIPDFPDDIRPLLRKAPSFHIALEKLRIAISETFGEFAVAKNAQTEGQMELLLQILPMYLHDELAQQLEDCYTPAKQPVPQKTFLVRESDEAELMARSRAATELLEELLAMDLGSAESWWLYSSLMLKHGDLARCEECVRRGLTCDPNHLQLSLLFGSLLTRQQKYGEAIEFLESCHFTEKLGEVVLAVLKGLANIPSRQALGEGESPIPYAAELLDIQDTVFAEQLIAQEQMANGETPEVLFMFGRLHYILRDFAKAASFLSRALAIERTADSALLLGHVEFERQRFQEAARRFEEGLEMRFEHGAALRLGFIYLRETEWQKAEVVLFQCSPQSASVCLGLAIAALRLEKYKQADELLNRATVINCRHPLTWAYIAILSEKLQRMEEAQNAAENAIKWGLDDENLLAELRNLGLIQRSEEEEDIDVSIHSHPENGFPKGNDSNDVSNDSNNDYENNYDKTNYGNNNNNNDDDNNDDDDDEIDAQFSQNISQEDDRNGEEENDGQDEEENTDEEENEPEEKDDVMKKE